MTLLGFCWFKEPNRNVHDPSDWDECLRRMQECRNYKDKFEDIKAYRQYEDEDFLEMQRDIEEVNKVLNRYNCELCQVKCHSEEYYVNHINGRKHKESIRKHECKKRKSEGSEKETQTKKRKTSSGESDTQNSNSSSSSSEQIDNENGACAKKRKYIHKKNSNEEEMCIKKVGDGYKCQYCEITLKYKKNIKPNLKTKKHLDASKHIMNTADESVHPDKSAKNNLDEFGFIRKKSNNENENEESEGTQTEEAEKKQKEGQHFWLEFNKPYKYKIAQRVNRSLFSCEYCRKNFISQGAYSRHCSSSQHLERKKLQLYGTRSVKRIMKRKEKMNTMIEQMAVCNEFSETKDRFTNSHSHMFLKSKEKYLFKDMKKCSRNTLV